jgi:hypothetical protein
MFKDHFWGNPKKNIQGLSFPQRTALLAMYGLPLPETKDERGFSYLDYFWAAQGYGEFDELGFLTSVKHPGPYIPQEYRELWMIAGVRSGKSFIADTVTAYEAVCGGHEAFLKSGNRAFCFQVAQDLRSAQKAIVTIKSVLDTVPFLTSPYFGPGAMKNRMMDEPTAQRINLWNGMSIMTMPPSVKAIRGYDSPCAVLDEIGVWPTENDAANVDTDVYDQASSRQATFEFPKILGLSSPWIMSGMLYEKKLAGTNGRNILCGLCESEPLEERETDCPHCRIAREGMQEKLVYHLPTAAFNNPIVKTSWLKAKKSTNPQNFRRECMAEFQPSAASFLDAAYVDECVDRGVHERDAITWDGKKKGFLPYYVAAIDSGFKHDAFGFGIGHADENGKVVIDVIRRFKPVAGQPNSPAFILDQIVPILAKYGCYSVMGDQYNFPALQQLIMDRGLNLEETVFTGDSKNGYYGNLYTLVNLKRIKLLDNQDAIHELKSLQRTLTTSGGVQIGAPQGQHDDLAVIIALLAARAVYLNPQLMEPKKQETYQDHIDKQIQRRRQQVDREQW